MFHRLIFCSCIVLAIGCSPRPTMDQSQRNDSAVNILPDAVLASMKESPSKKPTGDDELHLMDVISDSDQPHDKLKELLRASGLEPMLQQEGPHTILAPTDDAFSKLPPGVLDQLLLPSHHAALVDFLKYHLLKGRIDFDAMLHTNARVPTLDGPGVTIKGIGDKVMVNDANVIRSESSASNGVVHWLDHVLLPPMGG